MASENEVKFVVDVSQPKQVLDDVLNKAKQLNQTLSKETTAAFSKVSSEGSMSFTKLAGAIGLATGAYELLAEAARKTIETIKEGFNLYAKEESFRQRIGFALNNNALLTERMIKLRDELNKNPLFTKEQINQGIEFAVSMGRSESQVKKLVEAAEGYSRVSGKDFQTALTELNGTLNGTIGRLGKYVEGVKGMSISQAKNGEALEKAWQQLSKYGDKAGEIETAQAKLSKQWTETQETLGKKLAPVLTTVLKLIGDFVTYWSNVGEAAVRVGQRLYAFTEKYLKPIIPIVEGIVKGIKFLSTGLAEVILLIDKLTGGQDLYKAGDNMLKYQQKVQDDYAKADDKGKKRILEQQQKYMEEAAKKDDASSKRAYETHKKLISGDLQKLDLKSKPELDPAEIKKAEEAAKKKQEEIDKAAKKKFDTLKKEKEEREKYNKENLKLDEEFAKAESELAIQENENKIKLEQESRDVNLKNLAQLFDERKNLIKSGVESETKALQTEIDSLSSTLNVMTQTPEQYNNIVKNIESLQEKIKQVTLKGETEINSITERNRKSKEDKLKDDFEKEKLGYSTLTEVYNGYLDAVNKGKQGNLNLKDTIDQVTQLKDEFIKAANAHKIYQQELLKSGKITQEEFDKDVADIDKQVQEFSDKSKAKVDEVKLNIKDVKMTLKQAAGELAGKVINGMFDNMAQQLQQNLQKTLDSIDKATEKEQGNLDRLLKNKYISEAEYQKRKDKLDADKLAKEKAAKKEAAEKAKKAAFEQAVINALLAATMALATTTPTVPLGLIMAGVTLAMGMADAAIIASKPLEYKRGGIVPSFASGGFTSPYGDQNGIPATLHPNEGILNSTAMSAPGMMGMVQSANAGQPLQTTTSLHPDSINAIINGINSKQVFVSQYDITKQQNKVSVLQGRASL